MHVFITSAFITSQYTLRSGTHQRTGRPTHAGTNSPISPARRDTGGEKKPSFILQDVDKTTHRFCKLDKELLFWLCGRAHGDKTRRTRSDLKTKFFRQHKTSVKVQRLSSSSSTFALRRSLTARSWAIFLLLCCEARGSKQAEFKEQFHKALF